MCSQNLFGRVCEGIAKLVKGDALPDMMMTKI